MLPPLAPARADLPPLSCALCAGIEHRLHRKKVLSAIGKLRLAESEREKAFMLKHLSREQLLNGGGGTGSAGLGGFGGMGGMGMGMGMGGGGMGASEAAAVRRKLVMYIGDVMKF